MTAPWYVPTGNPATQAQGSSADIRAEFVALETALDKLPTFTADEIVVVNSGATALTTLANLTVALGGTGASTLTDGGVLLGSGTSAITAMAVLANSEMIVGDGTTDPVAESGDTLRISIGVGSTDSPTFTGLTLSTTPLGVASGGIGVGSLTDGGVLIGSGTSAVTAMGVLANSEMIVGDGTTDPVAESGATLRTSIGVGTGDSPTFTALTLSGTPLAVTSGGIGVGTLTDGGILLGSGAGAITATAVLTDGQMIVGDGTTDPVLESGATLRTSIGVGTGDSPTFAGLTLTADLTVANGGTGASTLTSGGVLLGSGTSAITAMAVLTDGQMIVGDGTTDPVAESGATLRTSIGVGTGDAVAFSSLTLTTDLAVAEGGTGVSTLTDGGILLGSGAGAITATAQATNGQVLIGSTGVDPVLATLTQGANVTITEGAGTITIAATAPGTGTVTSVATSGTVNGVTLTGGPITTSGTVTLGGTLAISNTDWSGTDLSVANGGTGVSTLTDGGILLGSGAGAITATAVLTDGQMVVGDGVGDPVLESGATLRTSIGVGTGDSPTFAGLTLTADLTVANGGTGASTLTDGGILLGSGAGAITATAQATNGQVLIGSTGGDPILATLTQGSNITITEGAGTITVASNTSGTVTSVATAGTENGLTLTGGPITGTGTVTLGGTLAINDADWSGTDLSVANGGTGVSTFTDGGILLGSGAGPISNTGVLTDGQMIVGDGTTDPALESGATLRTSIGVGTGDSPTFAGLTLTADLTVVNGGTGASTFTDGGVLLGSGTGAITAMAVLADSEMIVGDGTTDPVAESGATLRTSIGVGTGDSPTFTNLILTGTLDVDGNGITTESTSDTNTRIGVGAGASITTGGTNNTAIGNDALNSNTTADSKTAIGYRALEANTSSAGVGAVAIGAQAMEISTSAAFSLGIGYQALKAIVSGSGSTAIGYQSLVLCTASGNTAIGARSFDSLISGADNTGIGSDVGRSLTGSSNTFIGNSAGAATTSGSNNLCIGQAANVSTGAAASQISLGSGAVCDQDSQVTIGDGTNTIKNEFDTDNAWTQASDIRRKTNIEDAILGLDFINDLRPVTYNLRPADELPKEWSIPVDAYIDTKKTMHSFIAQEVLEALVKADVDPNTFAGWGEDNQGQRISKEMFVFPLVNAVKELYQMILALRSEIA